MTQYAASQAAGTQPWTWSRWERDAQDMRLTTAVFAARALGMTLAELVQGIE